MSLNCVNPVLTGRLLRHSENLAHFTPRGTRIYACGDGLSQLPGELRRGSPVLCQFGREFAELRRCIRRGCAVIGHRVRLLSTWWPFARVKPSCRQLWLVGLMLSRSYTATYVALPGRPLRIARTDKSPAMPGRTTGGHPRPARLLSTRAVSGVEPQMFSLPPSPQQLHCLPLEVFCNALDRLQVRFFSPRSIALQ